MMLRSHPLSLSMHFSFNFGDDSRSLSHNLSISYLCIRLIDQTKNWQTQSFVLLWAAQLSVKCYCIGFETKADCYDIHVIP